MTQLIAGAPFPRQEVPQLGGGSLSLGAPRGAHDWQMIVIYRGLHCPICKKYLAQLDGLTAAFSDLGVDVVALSGDGEDKARAMQDEKDLGLTIGYDLSIAQMRALGLYVSDPRSPKETDQPFPEPGLFVVNGQGNLQVADISNAPWARPDLDMVRNGIQFIRDNDYPVRGTHQSGP